MNTVALSAKKGIKSWLWDAFPGSGCVSAAFPWGQLCLVSCSFFFWKQALEPCSELVYTELIPCVSWSCSQVLDIHMKVFPHFIKQLSKKSSRRAWGT